MFSAQVQIKIDARTKERLHVVRHRIDFGAVRERERTLFVGATKKVSSWSLRPDTKTLAKEFPDFREHRLGTSDLEVVDINDEKNSKIRVVKARRPIWDLNEAALEAVSVAVLLPVRT